MGSKNGPPSPKRWNVPTNFFLVLENNVEKGKLKNLKKFLENLEN
jgi:hypothetical protein